MTSRAKVGTIAELCLFVFFLSLALIPFLETSANYPTSLGGNDNYLFCGSSKTSPLDVSSIFDFSSSLAPNQFSTQVNTYITGSCNGNSAEFINYQSVVRTGPNGENQFSMDYAHCSTTNNIYAFDILTGVDLSAAGVSLSYKYEYNSNNQVVDSYVAVSGYGSCGCDSDTFIIYVSQISGGQNEITSGYQHILVGSALQNGGSTTFTGGSGTIYYNWASYGGLSFYQSMSGVYTFSGELSDSVYGTPNSYIGSYDQSWSY